MIRLLLVVLFLTLGADKKPLGYGDLLKAHVKAGVVDYAGLKKHEKDLDAHLAGLAKEDLAKLTADGRLAFWINAYNAFTLKLILANYPGVKSIKDLKEPWDSKIYKAAGKTWSLNDIEHRVIRKRFDEPRIHFALVCAARSCPDLRSEAYSAEKLEKQLADQTRTFFADRNRGFRRGEERNGKWGVYLSRILDWYGDDFVKDGKTKIDFVLPYLSAKDREWVEDRRKDLDISWLSYDWALNGK